MPVRIAWEQALAHAAPPARSDAVRGTWEVDDDQARVTWFAEGGKPPRKALHAEIARLGAILDRALQPTIGIA